MRRRKRLQAYVKAREQEDVEDVCEVDEGLEGPQGGICEEEGDTTILDDVWSAE